MTTDTKTALNPEFIPNVRVILENIVDDEDELPWEEEPEEGLDYFTESEWEITVLGQGRVFGWGYEVDDVEWFSEDVDWDDLDDFGSAKTGRERMVDAKDGTKFDFNMWKAMKTATETRNVVRRYNVQLPPWYWSLPASQTYFDEWETGDLIRRPKEEEDDATREA